MNHEHRQQGPTFGYLSTWESREHGCFGGYLIVSVLGRPLEFHCTAPLRPSRAQQILYGPTLHSYLLGEQIGGTLLREAQLMPRIVLTDHPATLCLRTTIDVPIVQLTRHASDGGLRIADREFELPSGFEADRSISNELLTLLAERVDLAEPFERIRDAIREAQQLGERNPDNYEQSAA